MIYCIFDSADPELNKKTYFGGKKIMVLLALYQGFWRSEVHVLRRLRIRFVRQDLTCVYSDGFGCCFLIWVCFFNDYRWSIIHTFLFVLFAYFFIRLAVIKSSSFVSNEQ